MAQDGTAVLIVGAGASYPFTDNPITVKGITSTLLDNSTWENLFNSHLDYLEYVPNVARIIALIAQLKDCASDNFEEIVEMIDKISVFSNPRVFSKTLLYKALDTYSSSLFTKKGTDLDFRYLPFFIREIICGIVNGFNVQLVSQTGSSIQKKQVDFGVFLCESFKRINVANLNYDDCISHSFRQLGFYNGFLGREFQHSEFITSDRAISQLHGSSHFVPRQANIIGYSSMVDYYADCQKASETRWQLFQQGDALFEYGDAYPDYNLYITTGKSKDQHFYDRPYASFYSRLDEDLSAADIIFIIGYSFNDEHVNRILKELDFSDNKGVIIVDCCPDISQEDFINDKLLKIMVSLEQGYFKNSLKESELYDRLQYDGYCEISQNVYYYNKGYEQFLSEVSADFLSPLFGFYF